MPEIRPGRGTRATATKAVEHGAPCVENGFAGVAIKQQAPPAGTGLPTIGSPSAWTTVAIGEKFFINTKGMVTITNPGGAFNAGDPVYIKTADNTLQAAAGTGNVKFGRVAQKAPNFGLPAGKMQVDLDSKDSFV